MMRKLTLIFLLLIGSLVSATAQVRDSVTISIPPYTDTTCVGTQLLFTAVQSNDTFTGVQYHWYVNDVYTGVNIDTFLTTALNSGDSVYCWLTFTNSFGIADSSKSNTIRIYHAASIPPRVLVSLLVGSNPDCAGHPLTFEAYPVNGGITPQYQWMINGVELPGEDSTHITRVFSGTDTVVCRMISNSTCAPFDTAYSIPVPIIHINLTASISISAVYDTICGGGIDTFNSISSGYGFGATYQWYVNGVPAIGAIGQQYITDSLHTGDSVYVVLNTPDSCVLNPTVQSNVMYINVKHVFDNSAHINITSGANPGCLDSSVTFTVVLDSFGTAPYWEWYLNGVVSSIGIPTFSGTFANTDIVSLMAHTTDGQCYAHDTIEVAPVVMVRDTTPVAPVINLIGDMLSTYSSGTMTWYHNNINSYTGATLIPGASDTSYHPTMLGYYFAVANNFNCPSLPSNIIYISLLDVASVGRSASVNIYPNPTTGIISLDWKTTTVSNMNLAVYNSIGQKVIANTIDNKSHYDVDLSGLPNGNYYVELRDNEGQYNTYKIILEHN